MIIRPVSKSDIPGLIKLIRELAEFEKLLDLVKITPAKLRKQLSKKSAIAHVALVNDSVVGYAVFFQNFSTFLGKPGIYLEDIYVTPKFRKQKVGLKLLSSVAKHARRLKCDRMEWMVLNWNKNAIKFYEGIGAYPLKGWTTYRLSKPDIRLLAQTKIKGP